MKNKIIFWISSVIIFLWEAVMPVSTLIFAPQYTYVGTRPLGYPDYFAVTLVIFKALGATAILVRSLPATLREWAYAGLFFNLIFATISHAVVDGNIAYILMPVAVGGILALSYIFDKKYSNS